MHSIGSFCAPASNFSTLLSLYIRVIIVTQLNIVVDAPCFQGVESERCASFSAALKAGKPIHTPAQPTLADGSCFFDIFVHRRHLRCHFCCADYKKSARTLHLSAVKQK